MRKWIFAGSVAGWLAITTISAYLYVLHRVTSPDAEPGYETA